MKYRLTFELPAPPTQAKLLEAQAKFATILGCTMTRVDSSVAASGDVAAADSDVEQQGREQGERWKQSQLAARGIE